MIKEAVVFWTENRFVLSFIISIIMMMSSFIGNPLAIPSNHNREYSEGWRAGRGMIALAFMVGISKLFIENSTKWGTLTTWIVAFFLGLLITFLVITPIAFILKIGIMLILSGTRNSINKSIDHSLEKLEREARQKDQ